MCVLGWEIVRADIFVMDSQHVIYVYMQSSTTDFESGFGDVDSEIIIQPKAYHTYHFVTHGRT